MGKQFFEPLDFYYKEFTLGGHVNRWIIPLDYLPSFICATHLLMCVCVCVCVYTWVKCS